MEDEHKDYCFTPKQYIDRRRQNGLEILPSEVGKIGANYYIGLLKQYPNLYQRLLPQEDWEKIMSGSLFPALKNGLYLQVKDYLPGRKFKDLPRIFAIISEDETLETRILEELHDISHSQPN